ncbi:MAG TPA: DNA gyrase C-terminal beta-propeller domain-containing protein, partial [Terriglobia bacterium]|nr:DNA gyrase C-terminal beta-propeller domain-containing protein [Terriglobia bacterium]
TARNGKVVNSLSVTEDSEVMLITQQGKIARLDSAKIRECGRSSQGVKLINLGEEDQLAAACLIRAEDTDDDAQPLLIQ